MEFREKKLPIQIYSVFLFVWLCAAPASATGIPGNDNTRPATQLTPVPQVSGATGNVKKLAAADIVANTSSFRERRNEQVKGVIQKGIDDLNYSLSLAGEDIERLSRLVDTMTPLEPLKREYDIRTLLDWYQRYSDWNMDMLGEYEDRLEMQIVYPGEGESLSSLYAELAVKNRDSAKELQGMIRKFDGELQRLFRIIERRQYLTDRLQILREQLSGVEEKSREQRSQAAEKKQSEIKPEQIKKEIRVVQTELAALFDIKEELLKHYVVMIEMGRDEAFWLELKRGEYELLGDSSRVIAVGSSRTASVLAESYRRLIRDYESEIKRVNRRIEELDRKRSNVSPAGSFRDLDRSRELADFYQDRQQRYSDYINRLKISIGSFEMELSNITSLKKQ